MAQYTAKNPLRGWMLAVALAVPGIAAVGSTIASAAMGASVTSPAPANSFPGASAANPTVIELFQSQGCSSCPPANALLNAIADRPDVLALSFGVTYWDQLGWKDTFASPRYTMRQREYAAAGRGEVATPELIVNGTYAVVGSDRNAFASAVSRAGAPRGGPQIDFDGHGVRLGKASAAVAGIGPATVWLVRYNPRSLNVPIRAGENDGRTLPHRDIVRDLVKLGEWSGAPANFAVPASREAGLLSAVLIQRGTGGAIIAARRI